MDLQELYDNLSTELNTLGIRLDKNIYQGMQKESLKGFLSDFEEAGVLGTPLKSTQGCRIFG